MEIERITPEITQEDIRRFEKQLEKEDRNKTIGQIGQEIKWLESENGFLSSYIENLESSSQRKRQRRKGHGRT